MGVPTGRRRTSTWQRTHINAGDLLYVHDDSDTTSDTFEFTVSDGTELVTYTLNVSVAGDTDGDGLPDLLLGSESEGVSLWHNGSSAGEIRFKPAAAGLAWPSVWLMSKSVRR